VPPLGYVYTPLEKKRHDKNFRSQAPREGARILGKIFVSLVRVTVAFQGNPDPHYRSR
jgi:hypothetical protein